MGAGYLYAHICRSGDITGRGHQGFLSTVFLGGVSGSLVYARPVISHLEGRDVVEFGGGFFARFEQYADSNDIVDSNTGGFSRNYSLVGGEASTKIIDNPLSN